MGKIYLIQYGNYAIDSPSFNTIRAYLNLEDAIKGLKEVKEEVIKELESDELNPDNMVSDADNILDNFKYGFTVDWGNDCEKYYIEEVEVR